MQACDTRLTPFISYARYKSKIYLKREDAQPVFSFKIRGALNKMRQLTAEERARGVIAVSAGNHAQGVALAAQKLGIKATIVMPAGCPKIKWANVQRLGAEVQFLGASFDEAKAAMYKIAAERQLTVIPPYDDPYIIAGQGTVGVEILRQWPDEAPLDGIFVCTGGGGLLGGIACYVKRLRPDIQIVGVNAEDSDAMAKSFQAGERVELKDAVCYTQRHTLGVSHPCLRDCLAMARP